MAYTKTRRAVKGEVSTAKPTFSFYTTPIGLVGKFENFDMAGTREMRQILKDGGWCSPWIRDDFMWVAHNTPAAHTAARRAAAL